VNNLSKNSCIVSARRGWIMALRALERGGLWRRKGGLSSAGEERGTEKYSACRSAPTRRMLSDGWRR